jgi:hypothetical protein
MYPKVEFIRLTAVSVKAIKYLQLMSINGKSRNTQNQLYRPDPML